MNCRAATNAMQAVLVLTVCWLASSGCGDGRPERVPVSGQVLLNGQPLAAGVEGVITIQPTEGRAATGRISATDGTFVLSTYEPNDGCLLGTHQATIIVNALVAGEPLSLIDDRYRDANTSGLTVTIDGPTDKLKIELTGQLKPLPRQGPIDTTGDNPGKL